MEYLANRRSALLGFGLAGVALAAGSSGSVLAQEEHADSSLIPAGAAALRDLSERLARAPRRRDFRTVPMTLTDPMQWDHEALAELIAYKGGPRQIRDNTAIDGPWLNLMRNAMNAQIWSFKHPDFIVVSATHGPAQFALLDQAMWDKYQLPTLLGGKFAANTLFAAHTAAEADTNYESDTGAYSAQGDTVSGLMARGAVFMACHLAIWELTAQLQKKGVNPDHLSHEAMAADITNHLAPGVVLTPGMVATIPEFQQAGYHYIA
jgi:hypothetical protein